VGFEVVVLNGDNSEAKRGGRMKIWARQAAVVAMVGAVLAGCGKEDSGGSGGGGSTGGGGGGAAEVTPEEAFKRMQADAAQGKGEALWATLSAASKKKMGEHMGRMLEEARKKGGNELDEASKDLGIPVDELKTAPVEKIVDKAMINRLNEMLKDEKEKREITDTKWVSSEIKDGKAYCKTQKPDGQKWKDDYAVLVKEDGTWKVDTELTEKYEKEMRAAETK
jgi:hypothetical protein